MRDYIEIASFLLFMIGLFFALPVLVLGMMWLEYIKWQGAGNHVEKLFIQSRFHSFVHDSYVWLVVGSIFVIEILAIIWVSRKQFHHTTYSEGE